MPSTGALARLPISSCTEFVLAEEFREHLAAESADREHLVGLRIVLEEHGRQRLGRRTRNHARARGGVVHAAVRAARDHLAAPGDGARSLAITDEAHLPGGVRHPVRADRRVRDDRFVDADAALPLIRLARFGLQQDSGGDGRAEPQQERGRGGIGIVEDVGDAGAERGDAHRLAALVHQLRARIGARGERRGLGRVGERGAGGRCRAHLDKISALHGGEKGVGWASSPFSPKSFAGTPDSRREHGRHGKRRNNLSVWLTWIRSPDSHFEGFSPCLP